MLKKWKLLIGNHFNLNYFTKADIDTYIEADDDIINSSKIIAVVEEKVGYLESIVKSLANRWIHN